MNILLFFILFFILWESFIYFGIEICYLILKLTVKYGNNKIQIIISKIWNIGV